MHACTRMCCAGVNHKLKAVIERLHPKETVRRAREVAEDQGEAQAWLRVEGW